MKGGYCLGLESTAHTFGAGVCDSGLNLISNEWERYKPKNEGIIPWKSALYMADRAQEVIQRALDKAGIGLEQVGLIAFSRGPGIGNCLKLSCSIARYMAVLHGKEIIGVNHCHAHVEAGRITLGCEEPLVLYLSGGNSQIIAPIRKGNGKNSKETFKVLGETVDIGIGNLFDSVARELKFENAHGSEVEKAAANGSYHLLPYTVIGMNMVFSGIFTAASRMAKGGASKEDVCRSVMDTAFTMTAEATERALALTGKNEVLLCGGVALNRRLRKIVKLMCEDHGAKMLVPEDSLNADQGGMIALTGMKMRNRGIKHSLKDCFPRPDERIDQVEF